MRMFSGTVSLRVDDAWRRELEPSARRTVTRMTWPLLKRYGHLDEQRERGAE
jgi:hypothetical protein